MLLHCLKQYVFCYQMRCHLIEAVVFLLLNAFVLMTVVSSVLLDKIPSQQCIKAHRHQRRPVFDCWYVAFGCEDDRNSWIQEEWAGFFLWTDINPHLCSRAWLSLYFLTLHCGYTCIIKLSVYLSNHHLKKKKKKIALYTSINRSIEVFTTLFFLGSVFTEVNKLIGSFYVTKPTEWYIQCSGWTSLAGFRSTYEHLEIIN